MKKIAMQVGIKTIKEISFINNTPAKESYFTDGDILVRLSLEIFPVKENKEITLILGVNYHHEDMTQDDLLAYNIAVSFHIEDFDSHLCIKKDAYEIKPELLTLLTGVSVGSLRGMLALRTQNTLYDNYPLPIINITHLVTSMMGDPLQNRVLHPLVRFKFE